MKINSRQVVFTMNSLRVNSLPTIKVYVFVVAVILFSSSVATADEGRVFNEMLNLNGISFHVTCSNEGSLNNLMIVPSGLTTDNSVINKEIDGSVTGADIDDLNGDGSPEVYVYINSAGSGSYGSLVAYSSNNKKSISEIYLPSLENDIENSKGYMGHDEFTVMEGNLVRRFPIYRKGDTNANPTGGMRQLQYKLVAGEAAWTLQLINSILF